MSIQNPSELARETLKMLAQRRLLPTPDNYAKIYTEISGAPETEKDDAGKVLRGVAEHLLKSDKTATTGIALKKLLNEANWDACLSEIEKVLPGTDQDNMPSWPALIRDLLRQLDLPHKGLTVARKKEGLETVLTRFASKPEVLHEKLGNLIRSWSSTPVTASLVDGDLPDAAVPVTPVTPAGKPPLSNKSTTETIGQLSELLAQTLESTLSAQPELTDEIHALATQVRAIKTHEHIAELSHKLRHFWLKVELRGTDKARIQEGLIRLLRLLVENVGEMVEDEEWLHGHISALHEIIGNPLDKYMIADAERSLREAIIKQSMLKKNLVDAKLTLKNLMSTFIDRLGSITASTGDYHQKIEVYSQKIAQTNNLSDLGNLLNDIMQDTRVIQASALRSHEELVNSRKQVEEAEARIHQLERELSEVSELVQQDQLTGALNRRGLDDAFERESKRLERSQSPLCVALLDIDNFKRMNDTMGHQVGDQALIHLCNVIREALRPSDAVARYGGEEFIIILPGIALAEAAQTVERLQRELTRQYFLHENERVLVTFSAGVAQRQENEAQDEIIARADKAMYQAKKTGKNRVCIAK